MLEFQNVSIYEKEKKILDDLSLGIPEGTILGLIGSDDEAKSMLLICAAGNRQPDGGMVLFDGDPVYRRRSKAYARVGYMPGEYGFYELLRVEEYFDLFLSLYRINGRYRERRIEEVLNLMSLQEYRSSYISEVPEERLPFLCLGKTILHEPEWLFLDEPFANLNSSGRSEMISILLMLQDMGKSIVVNSRLFSELIDFYSDVALIEGGKTVVSGSVREVYEDAKKNNPVRMHVMDGMEKTLNVLKNNALVERVTVNGSEVIFRFYGDEREEAKLLSELTASGALIRNYMRERINLEQLFRTI